MLLASPYHLSLDPAESVVGKPFPPLAPLVSAAELQARGHSVAFYDATLVSHVDTFREALRGHRPTQVAILSDPHSVPVKMCTLRQREAALTMVRLSRAAGASVLVAGPDPTDHAELYAAAGASHVVLGEHDGALLDWADGRLAPGITPRRANTTHLDALPDPAWELVDLAAYAESWRRRHGRWELNVSTARGCPYRCNWCAKPTWGRSYHVASPERVASQIAATRERWRPDGLWFTDDIFAVKPSWLSTFRGLVGNDPLPFRCNTRADLVRDGAYVADLAAAGCREVWMGAESGSDSVLAAMDKDQTRADIDTAVSRLRSAGIRVGFFLQLGYPGERYDDVLATLDMVRSLRPDEIGISVSYPLPGTPFHDKVRDQLKRENWESSMANEVLFAGAYPQPFYDAVREVLRAESAWWTWRPGMDRAALRRLGALPWHAARWPVHRAKMGWFGRIHPHSK